MKKGKRMKNNKTNAAIQEMHTKATAEARRALGRADRTKSLDKTALLRDYAELWLRVCNTLELLDSEDFNIIR